MREIEIFKQEVREVLENNILRFWIDRMQDNGHGGFYGRVDGNNVLHKEADKGAILNARILWTFAAAYRVLRKPVYLYMAKRARDYFLEHFIDPEYGGVYWSVDFQGRTKDTKKQFYAIGFAIYGLTEYVRATGDEETLKQAIQLYQCIEEHALDRDNNGYIEAMTRDWHPISDMRLSEKDGNYPKSQNTHLHIMEAYTNLYRVWPAEELGTSLRNILCIFTDRIVNLKSHHLDLFFDQDWRCMSEGFSAGHDIECSWLLHEALMMLGDEALLTEKEAMIRLVACASEQLDWHQWHQWWEYAEAMVGYVNLYQHFDDRQALLKALDIWQYTKHCLIDWEHGEWFWSPHTDGSPSRDEDKAGFWKCPYHNGRMCLEIMERL